jgi:isochorismate synthase
MNIKEVKNIIKGDKDFVLYHLPKSKEVVFKTGKFINPDTKSSFKNTFVIQEFKTKSVKFLAVEESIIFPLEDLQDKPHSYHIMTSGTDDSESYKNIAKNYIDKLEKNIIRKIVLARKKEVVLNQEIEPITFLKGLCNKYPNSFTYIFRADGKNIWIGATPELFVKADKNTMRSASLAGTSINLEEDEYLLSSNKNILEQELVTDYIYNIYKTHLAHVDKGNPGILNTGNLKHIQTMVTGNPQKDFILFDFLSDLHPTPAVCGVPKQQAFEEITKNENFNREFYSGFLGPFFNEDNFHFFVNLRCMKMSGKNLTLFAGSGLVKGSEEGDEFLETENKFNTLLSMFDHD